MLFRRNVNAGHSYANPNLYSAVEAGAFSFGEFALACSLLTNCHICILIWRSALPPIFLCAAGVACNRKCRLLRCAVLYDSSDVGSSVSSLKI
ncbi:hypothetical protein CEXT_771121 [Caerostris extrusa]|uniref:Uncharacterized protein n=1 Tax=Caerostris extrusa TaxID=172846 RepID=A0AAV4PSH8_CAEEX|nr:hypothetical protein CEXT_771121 [Caerostris extrusa]